MMNANYPSLPSSLPSMPRHASANMTVVVAGILTHAVVRAQCKLQFTLVIIGLSIFNTMSHKQQSSTKMSQHKEQGKG